MNSTHENLGWDCLYWDKDLWNLEEGESATRGLELHNELESFRRAAECGDKAAARLIFRMSKMWCVHCVIAHAPLHDAEPRLWRALMAEENAYCYRTGDSVLAGTDFLKENPQHEITRSRAGRDWLHHLKNREAYNAACAAIEEREQAASMGSARGGPTEFYFDPTLELPENIKKARKLELADWDSLSFSQHCELAYRWARYSDDKASAKKLVAAA